MSKLRSLLALFFGLQAASGVLAQEVPYLSRPIVDEAGLMNGAEVERGEAAIRGLREATQIQMAVYVPSSLGGQDIEGFSMAVAEQWKLGKKGQDRGLLLVVAPREKRMRLEVGYGLEGQVTDALSRRILDEVLRPYLRAGRPADGIIAVVGAISEIVGSPWRPSDSPAPLQRSGRIRGRGAPLPGWVVLILFGFFFLFILVLAAAQRSMGWTGTRRRHGGFGSGGFGGGGGGFSGGGGWSGGGGGFGGGGSSSSW